MYHNISTDYNVDTLWEAIENGMERLCVNISEVFYNEVKVSRTVKIDKELMSLGFVKFQNRKRIFWRQI